MIMASDLLPVLDGLSYEALPLHARLARATLRLAQTQRPTQRLRLRPLALGRGDVKEISGQVFHGGFGQGVPGEVLRIRSSTLDAHHRSAGMGSIDLLTVSSDPTRLAASDVRAACDAMRNAVLDGAKSLLGGLHVGCVLVCTYGFANYTRDSWMKGSGKTRPAADPCDAGTTRTTLPSYADEWRSSALHAAPSSYSRQRQRRPSSSVARLEHVTVEELHHGGGGTRTSGLGACFTGPTWGTVRQEAGEKKVALGFGDAEVEVALRLWCTHAEEQEDLDVEFDGSERIFGWRTPVVPDCAVCLLPNRKPMRLPCRHTFCCDCVEPMLRSVAAAQPLQFFGRALRGDASQDLHGLSRPTQEVAQFWSHSWHGKTWRKIMLLIYMYSGHVAMISSLIVALIFLFLASFQVLPSYDLEYLRQENTVSDQRNVGGILKNSKSMLVLFDSSYAQRLWCIYELAAFLKAHEGEERALIVRPTALAPGLCISFWTIVLFSVLVTAIPADNKMVAWGLIVVAVILVTFWVSWALRIFYRELKDWEVEAILKDCKVSQCRCYCCDVNHVHPTTKSAMEICDREILLRGITMWFGSVETFEQMVCRP
eukprot:g14114.t1